MITHVDMNDRKEREEFLHIAASYMQKHPECKTYTHGDITPGELFAVRWGLGEDCIVIFRLDEFAPVELFPQVIKEPE